MICRHVIQVGIENFDYFNDYKDTIAWLRPIAENSDDPNSDKAKELMDQLKKGNDEFLKNFWSKK